MSKILIKIIMKQFKGKKVKRRYRIFGEKEENNR